MVLNSHEIDDDVIKERVSAALKTRADNTNRKAWIGQRADDLKVHEETFSNWLHGRTVPTGGGLIALFALFGPEFTNEILDLAGQAAARIDNIKLVAQANQLGKADMVLKNIAGLASDYLDNVVDLKETA